MPSSYHYRRISVAGLTGLALGSALVLGFSSTAQAATVLDGPITLKTAAGYAVLAGSTVTNTGPTVVTGDVGLSPGTAIDGFEGSPAGSFVVGTGSARTDPDVDQAKIDLDEAFGVAKSLTPQAKGLSQLAGKTLKPGVYSGGALDLASGSTLTLDGGAASVWVFQASSTLVTGSGSRVLLINGASICNVFWQVGSSATLGSGSTFVGTIMAQESISVGNAAVVQGRLLASTSAVTLINDTIVRPSGCTTGSGDTTETTTPEITTDSLDDATVGTPYEDTVATEGTPTPTVTVTEGELPAGLVISENGTITGTPTTPGTSTFTITASNGDTGDVTASYTIVTEAAPVVPTPPTVETPSGSGQGGSGQGGSGQGGSLAATGFETGGLIGGAVALLALGLLLRTRPARRRS
ncbi:ice-binding family protein [Agreia sp. PsM10]|uniref:ice-binding family protein n=1 Tax=Agreia sp. PsM10 TaxID=3030533 RepID=UPI00263AC4FE|nr:ice-binding family protein [Agreia sp. PsM10]MDN4640471.1 ice-binding family protein [Agreia sp. PsM10]